MTTTRENLMAKRYQKIQAAFTDFAPLWLINDEYHPKVDSFFFNVVYCHPVHGWINQHVRYDTFNDVLYHIGESSVSQEALLLLEENDPFVSGNGTASIPNHPGNQL